MPARRRTRGDIRRENLRTKHFGEEAAQRAWNGPDETGYFCASRLLPIVLQFTNDKRVVGKHDCARVYIELLSRDWGQGVVELVDPESHAFRAGYKSPRAARTWTEQIRALEREGLIEIQPRGRNKLGIALIVHPRIVIAQQHAKGNIDEDLWAEYELICEQFGLEDGKLSSRTSSGDTGQAGDGGG